MGALFGSGSFNFCTKPLTTANVADPAALVAANRLLGQPAPTAPDRVWVGDILYLSNLSVFSRPPQAAQPGWRPD